MLSALLPLLRPHYDLSPGAGSSAEGSSSSSSAAPAGAPAGALSAPWLSSSSLARYSSVHCFLLRLRCVCSCLQRSRQGLFELRRQLRPAGPAAAQRGWAASSAEEAAHAGAHAVPLQLFLCLHSMQHVLGALSSYVATAVLEAPWQLFRQQLLLLVQRWQVRGGPGSSCGSSSGALLQPQQPDALASLREVHDCYTRALLARCFLPPLEVQEQQQQQQQQQSQPSASGSAAAAAAAAQASSAFSGAGAVAARLLHSLLELALRFCATVDSAAATVTASLQEGRGRGRGSPVPFPAAALAEAKRQQKDFSAGVATLAAGLRAASRSGGGYAEHVEDLLQRLAV